MSFQIPTTVRDATFALFADEYKVPLISPTVAAYLASGVEFVLPLLLLLGLLTRLSAFGLLMMTLVIQIFVFPDAWWTVHAYWTAILVVLIARGPGAISLDRLLFQR
jgi:putative oxidoreductase